ncbi:uncharacterized protein LOC135486014 isoform X2 [Lineus longissimus]|uniref:uncharacterized protein LOC135486014 isoform X2 n=1 Tax=Lineus longissimus TaxID=88925 RepID=UPI002B4EE960
MPDQKRTRKRLRVTLPPRNTQEAASSSTSTKEKADAADSAATCTGTSDAPERAATNCTSPAKEKSPQSDRSGASSPEQNCAICLGKLENKSFTDSCLHMFCFVCLLEWSKVKPVCPLCQQQFKRIIHNVRSIEDFEEYEIPLEQPTWENPGGARFRYRTTQTHNRLFQRFERNFANMLRPVPATSVTTRSQWRFRRQNATADFRRRVYQNHMWVQPHTTGRVRSTSAEFYTQNPATTHRLIPWLNRELLALLNNQEQVHFLLELIIDLTKRFDIQSQDFLTHIQPYIGDRTEHFIHEFYQFACSPHDMVMYDEEATYNQPEIVDDNSSDSDDSDVMVISQTDILPNVSTLHNYAVPSGGGHQRHVNQGRREPPAERRGGGDFPDITPLLLQDVHNFLSMADSVTGGTGRGNRRYGLGDEPGTAHSGWESPTPGTSWLAPSQPDFSLLMSDVPLDFTMSRNNSTAETADNVPTQESDGNDSDLEIIGYEKPKAERTPPTPILISSDSDESIDVVATHQKKKKHKKSSRHDRHGKREGDRRRSRSGSRRRHRSRSRHSREESRRRSRSRSQHRPSLWQGRESSREQNENRHERLQSLVRPVGIALDIHRKSSVTGKRGHYHWEFSSPGDPRNPEMYSTHRFHGRRQDGRHSSSETSTTERPVEGTRGHRTNPHSWIRSHSSPHSHSSNHSHSSQKLSHRRSISASRGGSVEVIEKSSRKRSHKKHKKNKKHKKHKRARRLDDSDGFEIVGEPNKLGELKSVNQNEEHSADASSSSGAKCKKHPTGHKSTKKSSAGITSQIGAYVDVRSEESQKNHEGASKTTSKPCVTAPRTGPESVVLDLNCGGSGVQHATHSASGDVPVHQSSNDHPLFPIMNSSQNSSLGEGGGNDPTGNAPDFASPCPVRPTRTIMSKWDKPENSDSTTCDEPGPYSEKVTSPLSCSLVDHCSSYADVSMESEKGKTANEDCAENYQEIGVSCQDLNADRLQSVVTFKQTCINQLTEKLVGEESLFLNGCSVDSGCADKVLNTTFDSSAVMSGSEKAAVGYATNSDILDSGYSSARDKSRVLTSLTLKFRNGEWQNEKLGEKQNSLVDNSDRLSKCLENRSCATDLFNNTSSSDLKNPPEPKSLDSVSWQIQSENSLNVPMETSQVRMPSKSVADSDYRGVAPSTSKDYQENNFQVQNEISDISSVCSDNSSQEIPQNSRNQASLDHAGSSVVGNHTGRRSRKDVHKRHEEMFSEDSYSDSDTYDSETYSGSSSGVECTSVSVSTKKNVRYDSNAFTASKKTSVTVDEVVTIGDSESEVECTGFVQQPTPRSTTGSTVDVVGINSSESDSDVEIMSHHINFSKTNHVDKSFNFSSDSQSRDLDTSNLSMNMDHLRSHDRNTSDINVTDFSASEQGLSPWENVQEPIIDVEIVTSGNETVDTDATEIDVVNAKNSNAKKARCETSMSDSDSDQLEIVVDTSPSFKKSLAYMDDSFSAMISSPDLEFECSTSKQGDDSETGLVLSSKSDSWLISGQNDYNKANHATCSSFLGCSDSDESVSISVTSDKHDLDHVSSVESVEQLGCNSEIDISTTETTWNESHTKHTDSSGSPKGSPWISKTSVGHAVVEDNLVGQTSQDFTPVSEKLDVGLKAISTLPHSFSIDFPSGVNEKDLPDGSTSEDQTVASDSSFNSDQFVEELCLDMNSSSTSLHPEPNSFNFRNLPEIAKESPLTANSDCVTTMNTSQDQDTLQNNSDGSLSLVCRDSEMTEDRCDELQNQSESNPSENANDTETDLGSESYNGDSTSDCVVSEFLLPIGEAVSDSNSSSVSRSDVDENCGHGSEMAENSCNELKDQSNLNENEDISSSESDLGAASCDGDSPSDHAVSDFLMPVNEDVSDSS